MASFTKHTICICKSIQPVMTHLHFVERFPAWLLVVQILLGLFEEWTHLVGSHVTDATTRSALSAET